MDRIVNHLFTLIEYYLVFYFVFNKLIPNKTMSHILAVFCHIMSRQKGSTVATSSYSGTLQNHVDRLLLLQTKYG